MGAILFFSVFRQERRARGWFIGPAKVLEELRGGVRPPEQTANARPK